MRARLLVVLSVLGLVLVLSFAVPLARSVAQSRTNEFSLSRSSDLERFVALAGPYVRGEGAGNLFAEIDTYTALYGEPVGVVSTRGLPAYPTGFGRDSTEITDAVGRALRNLPDTLEGPLTPWGPDHVVFARATGTGPQITGAVVLVATTASARTDIAVAWAVIVAGALIALVALSAFAFGVSTWVLRPLGRLSRGMGELVSVLPGANDGRDEELLPVAARSGPPELRALSRTFALMAGQVRRSTEAQRRLVADTAHQLRNPLAALQLRLDALDGQVAPAAEPGYRRAVTESERLGRILDDLLVLSRAEVPPGIGSPDRPECLPALVAAECAAAWQEVAEQHGVRIEPPGGGIDLVARFDADDLAQILDVLLDNACKYAGPGSTVRVGVEGDATGVRVRVGDTGRGVDEGELGRLRERFYRGASAADARGTGLGLSIAEALASAGGGRLDLDATRGGGLTAEVLMPRAGGTP